LLINDTRIETVVISPVQSQKYEIHIYTLVKTALKVLMTHESFHCPAGTHPCGPTFQRKRRSLLPSRVASSPSVSLDVGAAAAGGGGKHTGPHAIQCSSCCCCSYQGMISTSRAKVCVASCLDVAALEEAAASARGAHMPSSVQRSFTCKRAPPKNPNVTKRPVPP
jgi:hypothetical protein